MGVSLQTLLRAMAPADAKTGSVRDPQSDLQRLLETYKEEKYLLWFDLREMTVLIVVKEEAETETLLKAWAQALLLAHHYREASEKGEKIDGILQIVQHSLEMVSKNFDECLPGAQNSWMGHRRSQPRNNLHHALAFRTEIAAPQAQTVHSRRFL